VIVTNTLPVGEDKLFPQLTVLSIAPLLASTIRAVFEKRFCDRAVRRVGIVAQGFTIYSQSPLHDLA